MKNVVDFIKKILKGIFKLIYGNLGFIIILGIIVVFRLYFVEIDSVVGTSMEPTLYNEDVVMVDTKIYKFTGLDRFDIIVFDNDDSEEEEYLVKRIIGLPGEVVEIKDGELLIDNKVIEVDENIMEFNQVTNNFNSGVIPEGHFFVLGDNRVVSLDSRSVEYVGFVSEETISGKVVFRQRPVKNMGFVK
ncbi:MAG: signal peptidase I [Bacilli bacterium]